MCGAAGGIVLLAACAFPAAAGAEELTATPATLGKVFEAAAGGDRIELAGGDYGSFAGGEKPSTVTIAAAPGATVTIGLNFNPASNLRVEGLTIQGLAFLGTTNHVTVANSTFTGMATVRTAEMVDAHIVFDHNTHAGIDVCDDCYEGRLQIADNNGANGPSGVTIEHSVFGPGGNADGVQIGADGVRVLDNEFVGIRQTAAPHTDALQLFGATNTVIERNYVHDSDTALMAADGGLNELISDNVFIGGGSYRPAIQLGGHTGTVFAHNVTRDLDVYVDAKSGQPPGEDNVVLDNVFVEGALIMPPDRCVRCTATHNLFAGGSPVGSHAIAARPVFAAAMPSRERDGWRLAHGSPGAAAATDGTDLGIRRPKARAAVVAPLGTAAAILTPRGPAASSLQRSPFPAPGA